MPASIDFRELDRFYRKMKITKEQYNGFLGDFLVEMGESIIGDTKANTPFDTGALKASWGITTKKTTPYETMLYSTKSGVMVKKTFYNRMGKVIREGFGKTMSIILNNPQDYASDIEYGFTMSNGQWYEGRYMLQKALNKNKINIAHLYDLKFNAFKTAMGL